MISVFTTIFKSFCNVITNISQGGKLADWGDHSDRQATCSAFCYLRACILRNPNLRTRVVKRKANE